MPVHAVGMSPEEAKSIEDRQSTSPKAEEIQG
jgi:hypothetical protein